MKDTSVLPLRRLGALSFRCGEDKKLARRSKLEDLLKHHQHNMIVAAKRPLLFHSYFPNFSNEGNKLRIEGVNQIQFLHGFKHGFATRMLLLLDHTIETLIPKLEEMKENSGEKLKMVKLIVLFCETYEMEKFEATMKVILKIHKT